VGAAGNKKVIGLQLSFSLEQPVHSPRQVRWTATMK
jgi:hypothetical protein